MIDWLFGWLFRPLVLGAIRTPRVRSELIDLLIEAEQTLAERMQDSARVDPPAGLVPDGKGGFRAKSGKAPGAIA